jgi:hypothetical protein
MSGFAKWAQDNAALLAILWPLLTALVTILFKPRTDDEYAKLPPRVAAFLKLVAALGLDVPKVLEALGQVASGSNKKGGRDA